MFLKHTHQPKPKTWNIYRIIIKNIKIQWLVVNFEAEMTSRCAQCSNSTPLCRCQKVPLTAHSCPWVRQSWSPTAQSPSRVLHEPQPRAPMPLLARQPRAHCSPGYFPRELAPTMQQCQDRAKNCIQTTPGRTPQGWSDCCIETRKRAGPQSLLCGAQIGGRHANSRPPGIQFGNRFVYRQAEVAPRHKTSPAETTSSFQT